MSEYRLYYFGVSNKIEDTDTLDAKSDDEAVVLVRARKLPVRCEIWERDRLVSDVRPHQP